VDSVPPGPTVKGVMFRTVLSLAEAKLGGAGLARIHETVPDDLAAALHYNRIVPSGWYSVVWFRGLLSSSCNVAGGSPSFVRDLGREGLHVEFNSVYRAVMRLLKPESLLNTGLTHFSRMYSVGKASPVEFRTGYARIVWSECAGFDRHIWEYILGACTGMIELTGGADIQIRIVKGGHADECEAFARWQ
jgi:hypothetical protein